MKLRRRHTVLLAALLVIAGCQFVVVRSWAVSHVQRVSGGKAGEPLDCTRCHGSSGAPILEEEVRLHPEPWALARAGDGHHLFVGCGPTQEVAVIDVQTGSVRSRVAVGGQVGRIAVSPDGRRLAASLPRDHRVALVDLGDRRVERFVRVGQEPQGLAWDAAGERLFVANTASSSVSVVDAVRGVETHRVPAGREPYRVVRSPDGKTIAAVSRRAELDRAERPPRCNVTLIDARSGRPRRTVVLPSCHMSEGAAFTPDGRHLLVPAILVRNLLPILQVARGWVMSSVLAVIDVASGRVALMPLTEANTGFPDPAGIAISPDGRRAYVAVGGGDQLAVIDLETLLALAEEADDGAVQRLAVSRRYVLARWPVGGNPKDVEFVGTEERPLVAVAERLGDSVALVDPSKGVHARVQLASGIASDAVHRGSRVFHLAGFTFQRAFSCRSCHPGAHTDGLTYDFDIDGVGRNILLNRSLRGVAGTAPFKWSGLNPTLQRQCGMRFAKVLTRADVMAEQQLNDLVAYLHSLPPPPPEPRAGLVGGRNTGAIERGREIFERTHRKDGTPIPPNGRCVTCHPPPLYTNRMRADVGTFASGDSSSPFDVPHLTGGASKAPFLHDGRALTLEEIWTLPDVRDKHGVVTDLNKSDLNDLIEFLKGL